MPKLPQPNANMARTKQSLMLRPNDFRRYNHTWFLPRNSDTLLITAGDSWTFGDSLGDILETSNDDKPARLAQVYGKHIADHLNADWYNHGKCAGSNFDIALDVQHRIQSLKTNYKNIYVIVTLTEVGRFGWEDKHLMRLAKPEQDSDLFMKHVEQVEIDRFRELDMPANATLLLARNFTTSYDETNFGDLNVAPKNWVQINFEANKDDFILPWDNKVLQLNQILCTGGITKLSLETCETLQCSDYKDYFIKQFDSSEFLRFWLPNNGLNHNASSCHPTAESHKIWADYLITLLN